MPMQELPRKCVRVNENILILLGALIGFTAVMIIVKLGMQQKWHSAVYWTIITFGAPFISPRVPMRWQFWALWVVCLALHLGAIWVLFSKLLAGIERVGLLHVLPVAILEAAALRAVFLRLERLLANTRNEDL